MTEETKSWSWWTGYNYGNECIRINNTTTNEAEFWEGLADCSAKRSIQIKKERLEALINQPAIING